MRLFIVDFATFTVQSDGGYTHRIEYTEWEGDTDGRPHRVRTRWVHNDFGQWTQSGTTIATVSGWLQNHIMTGDLGVDSEALRRLVEAVSCALRTPSSERIVR